MPECQGAAFILSDNLVFYIFGGMIESLKKREKKYIYYIFKMTLKKVIVIIFIFI